MPVTLSSSCTQATRPGVPPNHARRCLLRGGFPLALLGLSGCSTPDPLAGVDLAPLEALASQVSSERLMAHVEALTSLHTEETPVDCSGWTVTYEQDCHLTRDNARAYIESALQGLGYTVRNQFTEDTDDGLDSSNVVAELPGTINPSEVVLIGAHFDAFYSGADDNATGVAALLELATLLKDQSFPRTIRFVAFDLEEFGLVGSTRYVNAEIEQDQLVGGIVVDCIGYYDETPGSQGGLPGFPLPDVGNFVGVIANRYSEDLAIGTLALGTHLDRIPVQVAIAAGDGAWPMTGDLMRSDHAPFWLAGQPMLFFTDTANFRNPNYHEATDLVETLTPERFAGAVSLMIASTAWMAGGGE